MTTRKRLQVSGQPTEPPAVRAERLRVVLNVCGGMPYLDPRDQPPLLSSAEVALMEAADDVDLALVNACLEVEDELRERSYAAVERLAASVAGRRGELDDRIRSLPEPEIKRAIGDLFELGWID